MYIVIASYLLIGGACILGNIGISALHCILIFIAIIAIPLLINIIKTRNYNKVKEDFIYILKITFNFSIIILFIAYLYYSMKGVSIDDKNLDISKLVFQATMTLFIFLSANILGNGSNYIYKRVYKFLDSIKDLLKRNFLFNIAIFILIVEFKNNNEIFLALLGSYIFFILTTINDLYNGKDQERISLDNETKEKITLNVIMNIVLLYIMGDFLKIMDGEILINDALKNTFYIKVGLYILLILLLHSFKLADLRIKKLKNIIKR